MTMRRPYTLWIGALVVTVFGSVGLAEASLRFCAAVARNLGDELHAADPMAVEIEPVGVAGYRQRPNSVFHYANGTTASSNALAYRGPVVTPRPAPGTVRIVLLGGSTTHGFGVRDDETIDDYMRRILGKRHPDMRVEVVNLAFDGYDSYQDLQRFTTDGLRLHPDIVIANTGINDVRDAWYPGLREADPRTLIWEPVLARLRDERARGRPTIWTLVKHYLYTARIPGYVRDQLRQRRYTRDHEALAAVAGAPAMDGSADDDTESGPPFPDAAEFFERHVRALTSLAQAHGIAVVLSTPPSALPSYAPTATSNRSYWIRDARTTQAYRDELARRLQTIAADQAREGHTVRYIAPTVPLPLFLDDCHLTAAGNKVVAEAFADVVDTILATRVPRA